MAIAPTEEKSAITRAKSVVTNFIHRLMVIYLEVCVRIFVYVVWYSCLWLLVVVGDVPVTLGTGTSPWGHNASLGTHSTPGEILFFSLIPIDLSMVMYIPPKKMGFF